MKGRRLTANKRCPGMELEVTILLVGGATSGRIMTIRAKCIRVPLVVNRGRGERAPAAHDVTRWATKFSRIRLLAHDRINFDGGDGFPRRA